MGKRSHFERRERDFYPTPPEAVLPLLPYLRGVRSFAEPGAGDGALVRVLEGAGLTCVYAGDVADGQDALARDNYGVIDCIITNPPYTREILHRLVPHFQKIAPTWLLLPSDWAFNLGTAPFLPACTTIVPIGRVKWIAGTTFSSVDNFAWYRFQEGHTAGPVLHGRGSRLVQISVRACVQCFRVYTPIRSSSRYCSGRCRTRACRARD
jgi:hypothetical protein